MNPAREALTRAVNRAIAEGAPVYTNLPAKPDKTKSEVARAYAEANGIPVVELAAPAPKEEDAAIMRPIINLNGTSPDALIEARVAVRRDLRSVMTSLGETAPNGRDYIGNPEAYKRDLAIYRSRFAVLDALYNSLGDEALDIQTRAG